MSRGSGISYRRPAAERSHGLAEAGAEFQADHPGWHTAKRLAGTASVRPHALDLRLPDQWGLEVFYRIHQTNPRIPVIFVTGCGTTETAIEAMKLGAYDYLVKPVEVDRLTELVRRAAAISQLMRVPDAAPQGEPGAELTHAWSPGRTAGPHQAHAPDR